MKCVELLAVEVSKLRYTSDWEIELPVERREVDGCLGTGAAAVNLLYRVFLSRVARERGH